MIWPYINVLLQYRNEWDELRALQAMLVEIVWGSVARGDHDDTIIEEFSKQPFQHHRITNVSYLEEAQQDNRLLMQ